jgi:hypothetical protein
VKGQPRRAGVPLAAATDRAGVGSGNIVGDGKGHFHAACVAVDMWAGDRLTFGIDFVQTELPEILLGLDAVCEAFPVVGKP